MKHFKLLLVAGLAIITAWAAFAFVPQANAGGNELAYFKIQELPTLSPASVATGDLVAVYDASVGKTKKVDATGSIGNVIRSATDAVASGQTSKAVTVTGVTTASKCVASSNEVATNSVSVRAVVPTANTVTVTVSGDPGVSNMDLTVICIN